MSPHIKRLAIGGSVVGVISMLVLSAIAVAHRDSRNMDAGSGSENPEYASQTAQPIAIPAGMINSDNSPRKFPHADLSSGMNPDARLANEPAYKLPGNFKSQTSDNPQRNTAGNQPTALAASGRVRPTSTYANPLRSESYTAESSKELENEPSIADNDAAFEAPLPKPQVTVASYEHDENATQVESGIHQDDADESQVVAASGFDLPPSSGQQAGQNPPSRVPMSPPSLPSFAGVPGLPPDLNNPATNNSGSGKNGPSAGQATLLPPTSLPSSSPASLPSAFPGSAAPPSLAPSSTAPQSLSTSNTAPQSLAPSYGSSSNGPPALSSLNASPTGATSSANQLPPSLGASPALPPAMPPSSANAFPSNSFGGSQSAATALPQSANPPSLSNDLQALPPLNSSVPKTDTAFPSQQPSKLPPANLQRGFNEPANMVPVQSVPAMRASMSSSSSGQVASQFVSDRPGERGLDGLQAPNLQIMKEAPQEIQVGHPATFTILVKNVGKAAAHDVVVQDVLPQGTTLHASNPKADVVDATHMQWSLGTLPAGSQQVLTVEMIPQQEGEIGSIATVQFKAQAGVRTVVTQPKLVVNQQADPSVLIGEQCRVRITITNEGTGVAYDVKVHEDVPEGFSHPQGGYLGLSLNDLAPGQSKTFDLELEAKDPGNRKNTIRVLASNTEEVVSDVNIEIVSPQLTVRADGPRLRYLERQATYNVSISNMGTATARNIELVAHLPRGLRFNSAGNQGEYLPDQHAVVWLLDELAANGEAKTDLVVMPVEEGDFVLRFQTRADRATAQPFEKQVRVDGQSELAFTVEDDNDPIEVDGQTTYMIRLNNIGTRRDTNIQVAVELPANATIVSMSAPVEYQQRQNSIVFNPIPVMNPKDEKLFRFSVALSSEGTQMVRVNVKSDLRPVAVVKEESTQVYSDQ